MKRLLFILTLTLLTGCADRLPQTGNPLMRWQDGQTMLFKDDGLLIVGGYHSLQATEQVFLLFCVSGHNDKGEAVLKLLVGDLGERPLDCREDARFNRD